MHFSSDNVVEREDMSGRRRVILSDSDDSITEFTFTEKRLSEINREVLATSTNLTVTKMPKSKSRKRLRKRIQQSSSFQTTKKSQANAFNNFSYKNNQSIQRKKIKIRKRDSSSDEDLSELSDFETTEESEVDTDEEFIESDTDEVELLFSRCESISKSLQKNVNSLKQTCSEQKENLSFVTEKEASTLFNGELRLKSYQLLGLNWMHLLYQQNVNGILADEMGLGKTIQAMSLIALLKHRYSINGLHLIVAPGSTLENWRREMSKWLPNHRVIVYHGSQDDRRSIRRRIRNKSTEIDIVLTTYTYFERESSNDDRNFFYKQRFIYTVYDEAHAIKNLNSQRYKRLILINTKHRLLLSGTPVQNNLNELLATMSFAMPKVFKAESEQINAFFGDKDNDKDIHRLSIALKPFILRRVKKDVLKQLPEKVIQVDFLELETKTQSKLYQEAIESYKTSRACGNTSDYEHIFSHLRKVANHPLLVQNIFGKKIKGVDRRIETLVNMFSQVEAFGSSATKTMIKKEIENYSDWQLHLLCQEFSNSAKFRQLCLSQDSLWSSAKFIRLKSLLREIKSVGSRCVLFSQWTTLLDIIEELLVQIDFKYVRFDGQTAISERQEIADNFNSDKTITVFLLSTRAGGLGINLTSADTVIIHDLDFNPSVDQQATDRVHRIGQTKQVKVYKLVSKNTVDEQIYKMQQRKLELDSQIFTKKKKLGKRDLKAMLDKILNVTSV